MHPEGSEALYASQYQEYDSINQVSQYGQESAPVVVNNYNYYSDPNDYYYSSNLRRFSDNYYGWDYYDPYYTDLYFYTGRPMHWGMSIGWGYPGWDSDTPTDILTMGLIILPTMDGVMADIMIPGTQAGVMDMVYGGYYGGIIPTTAVPTGADTTMDTMTAIMDMVRL